jgi:dipeptidase D
MKAAHNGVYRMSPDVKDLVEASNNIARVKLEEGKLEIMCLTRSSVDSTKEDVALQLQAVFNLAGMQVVFTGSYPGWQPNPHSSIVSLMERIYTQLFESPR